MVSASVRWGIGPKQRYVLTVTGRQSRIRRSCPVSVVTDGATRYLVGPYGETAWVRNARAAGKITLSRGGKSERFALEALTDAEAGPILRRYVELEPITRPYFERRPGAVDGELAAEGHPVFRLMPIGS